MKYVLITMTVLILSLGVACRFLYSEITDLKEENTELQVRNDGLTESIRSYNNAQNVASKTITKIQEKVKLVKTECDCYNRDIDDSILKWVRGDGDK